MPFRNAEGIHVVVAVFHRAVRFYFSKIKKPFHVSEPVIFNIGQRRSKIHVYAGIVIKLLIYLAHFFEAAAHYYDRVYVLPCSLVGV